MSIAYIVNSTKWPNRFILATFVSEMHFIGYILHVMPCTPWEGILFIYTTYNVLIFCLARMKAACRGLGIGNKIQRISVYVINGIWAYGRQNDTTHSVNSESLLAQVWCDTDAISPVPPYNIFFLYLSYNICLLLFFFTILFSLNVEFKRTRHCADKSKCMLLSWWSNSW